MLGEATGTDYTALMTYSGNGFNAGLGGIVTLNILSQPAENILVYMILVLGVTVWLVTSAVPPEVPLSVI
mgnify:CR=1 FL=1